MWNFDIQTGDRVRSKTTGVEGEVYGYYHDPNIHNEGGKHDGGVTIFFKTEHETFEEEVENLEHVSFKEKVYSDEPNWMIFPIEYAGRVSESLKNDGIEYSASRTHLGEHINFNLIKWPDKCPPELAFIRAKNHAKYWVDEAPGRFAPNNSSDDYSRTKYH